MNRVSRPYLARDFERRAAFVACFFTPREGLKHLLALSLSECRFYKKNFRCQVCGILATEATTCK